MLLLESLVNTGDLKKEDYGYKLLPKALTTISSFERDEKRHMENVSQSKAMKWLTAVLMIVGILNLLAEIH